MYSMKRKIALALASTAFLAPVGVQTFTSTAVAMCAPDMPCPPPPAPPTARDNVITRAQTWLAANNGNGVPYSQTAYYGGYRTDCSGYASMALGYAKPGTNTVGLASTTYSKRIAMANLLKGDLVIDAIGTNTSRHVVIFEKWANTAHTSYWSYEQRGTYGTSHMTHSYGLGTDDYNAYRPNKLA